MVTASLSHLHAELSVLREHHDSVQVRGSIGSPTRDDDHEGRDSAIGRVRIDSVDRLVATTVPSASEPAAPPRHGTWPLQHQPGTRSTCFGCAPGRALPGTGCGWASSVDARYTRHVVADASSDCVPFAPTVDPRRRRRHRTDQGATPVRVTAGVRPSSGRGRRRG